MNEYSRWERVVRGSTHGLTDAQVKAAVEMCIDAESKGEPCCAWHAVATITGAACYCARCRPDIKRFA